MSIWQKPPQGQISEHFSYQEAACNCCGRVVDLETLKQTAAMMEQVRGILGHKPVRVISWCRCPAHNDRTDGAAKNSLHLRGEAVDFTVKHLTPGEVQVRLREHAGGMGRYPGFTHCDTGPRRRWSA